jgi:hypothetical protein
VWLVVGLALAGVTNSAPPDGTPPLGVIPAEVLSAAADARNLPLPDRMAAISEVLLGRPYALDPLGEGQLPDADPFARFDVFDCQTFLEEVLALSLAGDAVDASRIRDQLRYGDGPRDYVHRHHFMELQWVPNAIANGWLRDSTASYGEVIHMEKEIGPSTWAAWGPRSKFAHTDDQLPSGTMALDVLPLETAIRVAESIRPGTIVLTVRKDRAWSPIWISHVGFTVPTSERATVRHATKMGSGGTRDHGLAWYLEHLRTYDRLPAVGVTLLEPREQGPRVTTAALP